MLSLQRDTSVMPRNGKDAQITGQYEKHTQCTLQSRKSPCRRRCKKHVGNSSLQTNIKVDEFVELMERYGKTDTSLTDVIKKINNMQSR